MYLNNKITVLVPSAGSGVRMGGHIKKQYMQLNGKEVLRLTLENLYKVMYWDELFVIVPYDDVEDLQTKVDMWFKEEFRKTIVIAGGDTRQQSVFMGLNAMKDDTEIVIVHDGVRPFLPIEQTYAALNTLLETPGMHGIIAGVKITDTLKKASETNIIESTIDRDKVWAVQTPQLFKFKTLIAAHYNAMKQNLSVTDDAALLESVGSVVGIFESSRSNIKITEPYDLVLAEMILNQLNKKEV